MRGFLFELLPPLSELLKPPGRAFCRGPSLRRSLVHQILNRHYIYYVNLKAHQREEIYGRAVGLLVTATLQ